MNFAPIDMAALSGWSGLLVLLKRCAHHPLLPSILLAKVQSLDNIVDELRGRTSFLRDRNILCSTDSWRSPDILPPSIQPAGLSVHHAGRNKELSRKKKGRGVGFMINYSWCGVLELKSFCSPDLEYPTIKCRLH
jgi:hypothetical protein